MHSRPNLSSMLGFLLENLPKVVLFSFFSLSLLLGFQSAADMVLADDNFATIVAVCQSLFILIRNITIFFSIFVFFLCIYFFSLYAFYPHNLVYQQIIIFCLFTYQKKLLFFVFLISLLKKKSIIMPFNFVIV